MENGARMLWSGRITGLRHEDITLDATLQSGQMFRWSRDEGGAWRGMVGSRRVRLTQSDDAVIHYETDAADPAEADRWLRDFLRLADADLPALAENWCRADPLFALAWARQPGLRILRQEPDECFWSFLCASVAPIKRISAMLNALAGEAGVVQGAGYTAFPTTEALARVPLGRLRELGLGFRARRVAHAAQSLLSLPPDHLRDLRHQATHAEARAELCAFFGVGTKIADCVCLFALDKDGAVPVDTHIWRIASTHYAPDLAGLPLTPARYNRATDAFHDRFGPLAGWAQQTLFYRAAVKG